MVTCLNTQRELVVQPAVVVTGQHVQRRIVGVVLGDVISTLVVAVIDTLVGAHIVGVGARLIGRGAHVPTHLQAQVGVGNRGEVQ